MQVHLCVFVFVYTCVQWLCPGRPHSLSMGSSFHDLETIFTTGSHAARVGAGSKARHTITPRAPCSRVDMKIRYLRHVSARAPQAGPPVTMFSERVPLRCTRRHRTFQTHRARARARVRVPTCDMSVARPRTNAQHYAGCASATYDLGTYERSHRLTLGGRSALRIQGVLLSNHRGISCAPCRCRCAG